MKIPKDWFDWRRFLFLLKWAAVALAVYGLIASIGINRAEQAIRAQRVTAAQGEAGR